MGPRGLCRRLFKVYIACMRRALHTLFLAFTAGVLVAAVFPAAAQSVTPNYALTVPSLVSDPELSPRAPLLSLGPMRVAAAASTTGSGLSLQAGQQWFARAGVGRSLDSDVMSLGGGYRFADDQALSMHVTRQLGQDRLGLAVRYDSSRTFLRLSYDLPTRSLGGPDMLRFSAGMRF